MNKIIHCKTQLKCDVEAAFKLFTENEKVQSWLADEAEIEAVIGGKYELFWDVNHKEINSTIGCKITAIVPNRLLCFEWKGPSQFSHFMNTADPLTQVSVSFFGTEEGTDIHLIHSGWRSDEDWESARIWFERVWTSALNHLEKQ